MKLIVGLGNPGKQYEKTRHNAGFWVLDRLAQELDAAWSDDTRHRGATAKAAIGGEPVWLLKPLAFMNASGEAVQSLAAYYKIPREDILVIHDEMDLPPGRIAFITNGSHAGHNGIADIQEKLGTKDVARLRIGIGRPVLPIAKEHYVLGAPTLDEATLIEEAVGRATRAAQDWAIKGMTAAMNVWNVSV